MESIDDLVNDAEILVTYAHSNGITLPDGCSPALLGAKASGKVLLNNDARRAEFLQFFGAAIAALNGAVGEFRVLANRCRRLRPLLADAFVLLNFASANGKLIDDDIRNPLLEAGEALSKGTLSLLHEQAFMKAYQTLTAKLAPVTLDTLSASKTKLPKISDFFTWGRIGDSIHGLTLGRFVNALFFMAALIVTCVSLSYYSLGSTGLARYYELHKNWAKASSELPEKKDLVEARVDALAKQEKEGKSPEALVSARNSLAEARKLLVVESSRIADEDAELQMIPTRLWKWVQQPCKSGASYLFYWTLCSDIDRTIDDGKPSVSNALEAARTVSARLRDVYLPLLLGWLGAHAYILRKMTKEISENSFASSSALHHVVRVGLGALAGLASTWLLTPDVVNGGALKSMSPFALAFVAGYGIELIFSFMDRIISAFTAKAT
ncbi:hypothetical protein LNV09_14710 [Paucibacter sp. B2R-40]|uniref:hypothetical protein n=1 Tax=Paucibacter sp. B2R-40 TaxID=2893554 RepID=UPI0021E4C2C7|nr:hypothetical protein [Paucibacter sp. B2R-40]MCV2355403.1 hypothetical protein [Paucibacter sp. B2R-40]